MTQLTSADRGAENDYDERPAVLRLAGDLAGRRVLDAGCGAGALSAELAERGAAVLAFDSSAALLEIASNRLNGRGWTHRGDLREPLPFDAATFDVVIATLVMHHLQDWGPTLREFRRVLVPGGRLVISTHHPFMDRARSSGTDCFASYTFDDEWGRRDERVRMPVWHRPLSAMTAALAAADFRVEVVDEPRPDAEQLTTRPRFVVLSATGR